MPDPYITGPHAAQILAQQGIAEAQRRLWQPAVVQNETLPRGMMYTSSAITSGTLRLCGGCVIRAKVPVTNITHFSNVALVSPTNQWFCLVRQSDNVVLAKTVDDTTTPWAITSAKTLAVAGGPYVPTADAAVWLGILVVAATPPTLLAAGGVVAGLMAPGPVACNADAGLTTPASLGATVTPVQTSLSVAWAGWG